MPARIALNLRTYEQFVAAMGWDTQEKEAQALGVGDATIWRIRTRKTAPGEKFIARLLVHALSTRKWDFHDLFVVLDENDVEVQPAEPVQGAA